MFIGAFFYLSLLIGSFITWILVPKYIMFLLFSMVVLLFIITVFCSILTMKKSTVTYTLDKEVITRGNAVIIFLQRHGNFYFQCGKIISCYTISLNNKVVKQGQIINTQIQQEAALPIEHCGVYEYHVYQEYYYDLLQVLFYKRKQDIHKTIIVLPIDNQTSKTLPTGKLVNDTKIIQYTKGDDTSEIFELRNYREGDLLKHIHWKASMKQQEMLVKVGSEALGDAILIMYEVYPEASDNDEMLDILHTVCTKLNEEHIIYDIGIYDLETNSMDRTTIIDIHVYTLTIYSILSKLKTSYTSQQIQNSCKETGIYIVQKDGIIVTGYDGGQFYEKTDVS